MRLRMGFYCAIRYRPNYFRGEFFNVGVLVGDGSEIEVKVNDSLPRIFRAWGDLDPEYVRWCIQTEIKKIHGSVRTLDDAYGICQKSTSSVTLSEPLAIAIKEMKLSVEELYRDLVGYPDAVEEAGRRGSKSKDNQPPSNQVPEV